MSNELCYSLTREELLDKAKAHMVWLYGKPEQSGDVDKWMERFGLLVGFVDSITDKK